MSNNQEKIKLNGKVYQLNNIDNLNKTPESTTLWDNAIYEFLKNWFDDSDYIITHTSGSTGIPKEIRLAKSAMRNSAKMTNAFFGLDETKTALLCLPASYIAGKMMLVRAIEGGFNLITIEPKANPFESPEQKIDFTAITPYQLNYSAETLKTAEIENIIVGGGHVDSRLEMIATEIPAALYETYGMTETASHIALRRFNAEKSDYFTILEGISICQDERGCLVIKAPHLTNEELITNDIVTLKGEKSFKWLGRADAVINSGGVKIHPEQVEKKLEGIIPSSYFISSLPDAVLGEKVVLVIESLYYSANQQAELNSSVEKLLAKYEIPKAIYFVPEFIYSISNKIMRIETLEKIKVQTP